MGRKWQHPGLGAPGGQLNLFKEIAVRDSTVELPPCERCGETSGVTVSGAGPHWRGLRCLCGEFRKWLPRPRGEL
jgi:hypothetical protein